MPIQPTGPTSLSQLAKLATVGNLEKTSLPEGLPWLSGCEKLVGVSLLSRRGSVRLRPPRQADSDEGRVVLLDAPEHNCWPALLSLGDALFGRLDWWPPTSADIGSTLVRALGAVEPSGLIRLASGEHDRTSFCRCVCGLPVSAAAPRSTSRPCREPSPARRGNNPRYPATGMISC